MATGSAYYPFYPGDYARDTADLSMLEHGAYRLLLDFYYSEERLPVDRQRLYRIARANNRHERFAVDRVVERFFCSSEAQPGKLLGRRVERELAKRRAFALVQSEKGKKSGIARRTGVEPGLNRGSSGAGTGVEPNGNRKRTNQNQNQKKDQKIDPAADASGPLSMDQGTGNGQDRQPLKPRTRRKKEYPQEVFDLYEDYCDHVVRVPAKKTDTLRNIAARLKEGYSVHQLGDALAKYADECRVNEIPEDKRYHPNNFFGQKGYFLGYIPESEPADAGEEVHADG